MMLVGMSSGCASTTWLGNSSDWKWSGLTTNGLSRLMWNTWWIVIPTRRANRWAIALSFLRIWLGPKNRLLNFEQLLLHIVLWWLKLQPYLHFLIKFKHLPLAISIPLHPILGILKCDMKDLDDLLTPLEISIDCLHVQVTDYIRGNGYRGLAIYNLQGRNTQAMMVRSIVL